MTGHVPCPVILISCKVLALPVYDKVVYNSEMINKIIFALIAIGVLAGIASFFVS